METRTSFLKSLRILYIALLLGQLLFAAIVIILFATSILAASINGTTANIFLFTVVAIAVFAVGMSYKLFNQKLEEAKQQSNATDKLNGYRAAFILQLALCEGPAIFAIICYFLTANNLLLILLFLLLLNFAKLYPVKSKIVQQLEFDNNEESMLD